VSELATSHPHLHIFGRLLGFLRPYRWSLGVSIVLAAASQAASLALVRVTQSVIDQAIRPQDRHLLLILVAVVIGLGTAKALLMVGRRFISGRQALGVEYDMRNALYGHLLRLSFGFYDRHQTGQLMSRATVDLQGVRFFLGYGLIFFAQNLFTIVGATAIMLWTDWRLSLIAFAITPVLIILAYRYSRVSHPVLRDVQQKLADVATVAEENIVGVHVVKSFAQEGQEQAKFEQRSQAVFERTVDANRQRSIYVPVLSFIPLLAQAAVLLVGGRMVVNNQLTIGEFFAFNLYVSMLIMPLRMLGMWIGQSQRATAAGERIFQILDEPEEIADRPDASALPPGEGRIRFEGVGFGYDPERPVLEDIDLEIEPGQNLAVIGHTGSGKTTLTALVPRFYDVTSGRLEIDGVDVRDIELSSLRRAIAVISQDPFLFSTTVRENIAFGAPDATDREVEHAARLAQPTSSSLSFRRATTL
jgi:ABC-type multidrug transport system fused ATPase/permease subunit